MGTRSVRLDAEAETLLRALTADKARSVSDVLKQGLLVLHRQHRPRQRSPYEVYCGLDLGAGGYARGSSRDSRASVRASIRRKLVR